MSVDEYRTVLVALIRLLALYEYKHVLFTLPSLLFLFLMSNLHKKLKLEAHCPHVPKFKISKYSKAAYKTRVS